MRQLFFILFAILILNTSLRAQSYSAEVNVGISSIDAIDLNKLQKAFQSGTSLPIKITDSFPARPDFGLSIFKTMAKDSNKIGLVWNYMTTGGRLALSDYSGGVQSDQILVNHELGIAVELYFAKKLNINPFVQIQVLALFSRLKLNSKVWLTNNDEVSESTIFLSQNAGIKPSVGLSFNQLKMPVKLKVGYLIQVTDFPFYPKENKSAKLKLDDGNQIGPGLSGFRIAVSTEFFF